MTHGRRRRPAAITRRPRLLVAALVAVLAVLAVVGSRAEPAGAGGSRAVVIIDTGSGTYTRVISFSGTISGYDALVLAGANPETGVYPGEGIAICRLFGVGNDTDCLGSGGDTRYWAYYRAPGGEGPWQYSRGGAGASRVSDGDVEGWRFGQGNAPAFRSFCDVVGCAPPPPPDPGPPPPAPGGAGGGSVAASGGDAASPGATPGGGSADAPAPGEATTPAEAGAGSDPSTTAAAPSTTAATGRSSSGPTGPADRDGAARRALDARPVVAEDDGAGSPVGVLVALALVAVLATAAVVMRRRGRRARS